MQCSSGLKTVYSFLNASSTIQNIDAVSKLLPVNYFEPMTDNSKYFLMGKKGNSQ
jgi:hypothetical protein